MNKINIEKPEYYRLWQAIYNIVLENIIDWRKKLQAENPIIYDEIIRDEKVMIADAIFNISDKKLIELINEHFKKN